MDKKESNQKKVAAIIERMNRLLAAHEKEILDQRNKLSRSDWKRYFHPLTEVAWQAYPCTLATQGSFRADRGNAPYSSVCQRRKDEASAPRCKARDFAVPSARSHLGDDTGVRSKRHALPTYRPTAPTS